MDNRRFIELRRKNKLSQVLLSEKMHVSVSTIRNWERGLSMPTINDMKKLASIFNVDDNTIVSIFSSIKTDVETKEEEEDRYQRIFVDIFRSCYKVEDFFYSAICLPINSCLEFFFIMTTFFLLQKLFPTIRKVMPSF